MKKLSKKEQVLAIVLGIAVGGFTLERLLWAPLVGRLTLLEQTMEAKTMQLEKNRRLLVQQKRLTDYFKLYGAQLKPKGSDQEELARLAGDVEKLARKQRVKLTSLKPLSPEESGSAKVFSLDTELATTMPSLGQFLAALKTQDQVYKVQTLSIRSAQDPQAPSRLRVQLRISKILIP